MFSKYPVGSINSYFYKMTLYLIETISSMKLDFYLMFRKTKEPSKKGLDCFLENKWQQSHLPKQAQNFCRCAEKVHKYGCWFQFPFPLPVHRPSDRQVQELKIFLRNNSNPLISWLEAFLWKTIVQYVQLIKLYYKTI